VSQISLTDRLIRFVRYCSTTGGWFGVLVTALVTSAKLRYIEPG